MKICVICGAPPDNADGVGDFAWLLAQELSKGNRVSYIVPGSGDAKRCLDGGSIGIYWVKRGWGIRTSKEVLRTVKRLQPEILLVHFVPQLYGWNGAKPLLALLLLRLKRMGYPIVTVAHEFSVPFGPSPKLMLWATIHRVLFRLIVASSSRVVTTTRFCCNLLARRFSRRQTDLHQIPVSSAIPAMPIDESQKQALRIQLGIAADDLVVSTFGSVMRSTAHHLEELFCWFVREYAPVRLLVIGKAGEAMRQKTSHGSRLPGQITFTGPLSQQEVSKYLSLSDLYVMLYPDGASMRRTSLLAGLAHGLPTVSNVGVLTDPLLASSEVLHLIDDPPSEKETAVLRQLCRDSVRRRELGTRARAFYEHWFSWEKIGQQYQQVLREALAE